MINPVSFFQRFCFLYVYRTLLTCLLVVSSTTVKAEDNKSYITIATGAVTGVYYPAGSSICKLINKGRLQHHIRCSVEPSAGSVDNIDQVRLAKNDLGITQSDWQYFAFQGSKEFTPKAPYSNMRALFSLHNEPFNLIVRKDSNIKSVADLARKRVNIGNKGSGDRATMDRIMQQFGWSPKSFSRATELTGASRAQALCDNQIDAFVSILGNPNASIKEATTSCQAKLIPVTGPKIDKLVDNTPYYATTSIPANLYPNNEKDIKTFGTLSVVFTDKRMSDELAYNITKSVFENLDTFKRLHPAFAMLKKENMIKDGISAPLHPGAIRYYKEVGLLP
ncbi:TAXI family TRAP transporter solute-binding subunit [Vibrio algivorus]|uniref:C4-dicarboxylate ABC transporter substrate-binding protein n=1 Tax=Vibrio algivorus TaxID=1667024 RepID=A0A557PCY9_9VIBR|nr:TAXI family TRAP transporter solute-binding subunit [Vibrio algivorus]TVO38504.1 TAXI family TRAP transporter solute-binding subunit [Vibrio algivorus]GLT15186.1 C4-dicarboxylate ABC transporter substrate-binding protein [Vibrio algivorus]